jgi:signal peptide peptidase SppA
MKYAHIIQYFNSQPWAILPEKLHAMMEVIELRAAGLTLSDSEIEARIGARAETVPTEASSVAVLPIMGTISHRIGLLRRASGGMSVEEFQADFRAAIRNPDIKAIVLDIDSPGGSTAGVEELASEIYSARNQKRIIASVNSLSASAAYWLASAAHEIAVTPSGHVGSIGVLGVHMDYSKQAEAKGLTVTVVSAGKYKHEASEFSPLTGEARSYLQSIVDDRYDAFVRAVARGRNVSQKSVRGGFGEGRLVTAREALSIGMVDSIETVDQVLSRTTGRAARARKIAEAASWRFGIMGGDISESAVAAASAEEMDAQDKSTFAAQTLIVPKDKWKSLDGGRNWAKGQGYRTDRIDEKAESWHFHQRDPDDFQALRTVSHPKQPEILMVGGQLKPGIESAVHDPEAEGVDEFLANGVIPLEASEEIAPDGTEWAEPTLEEFTAKAWVDLADDEKRRIAMHGAWAKAMPPKEFADIRLFHHRPSDGAIVPNGVVAALNSLAQVGEDSSRVEVYLRLHMDAIEERREEARGNPELDPHMVELELMELG